MTSDIVEPPSLHDDTYQRLRIFLRDSLLSSPFLRADIDAYRVKVCKSMSAHNPASVKLISVAQRSSRRRWRNADALVRKFRTQFRQRGIVLVVTNVEESYSNPYEQLVRHAALDGLIGIHGAQMTHGIWLRDGSWIVELLPYVPESLVSRGSWTRQTTSPTPLGVMFDETKLNHIGVRLDRSSAPYCKDENDNFDCWNAQSWDKRDFVVDETVFESILDRFLVPNSLDDCNGMVERTRNDTVLYNVVCKDDQEDGPRVHHFYRKIA